MESGTEENDATHGNFEARHTDYSTEEDREHCRYPATNTQTAESSQRSPHQDNNSNLMGHQADADHQSSMSRDGHDSRYNCPSIDLLQKSTLCPDPDTRQDVSVARANDTSESNEIQEVVSYMSGSHRQSCLRQFRTEVQRLSASIREKLFLDNSDLVELSVDLVSSLQEVSACLATSAHASFEDDLPVFFEANYKNASHDQPLSFCTCREESSTTTAPSSGKEEESTNSTNDPDHRLQIQASASSQKPVDFSTVRVKKEKGASCTGSTDCFCYVCWQKRSLDWGMSTSQSPLRQDVKIEDDGEICIKTEPQDDSFHTIPRRRIKAEPEDTHEGQQEKSFDSNGHSSSSTPQEDQWAQEDDRSICPIMDPSSMCESDQGSHLVLDLSNNGDDRKAEEDRTPSKREDTSVEYRDPRWGRESFYQRLMESLHDSTLDDQEDEGQYSTPQRRLYKTPTFHSLHNIDNLNDTLVTEDGSSPNLPQIFSRRLVTCIRQGKKTAGTPTRRITANTVDKHEKQVATVSPFSDSSFHTNDTSLRHTIDKVCQKLAYLSDDEDNSICSVTGNDVTGSTPTSASSALHDSFESTETVRPQRNSPNQTSQTVSDGEDNLEDDAQNERDGSSVNFEPGCEDVIEEPSDDVGRYRLAADSDDNGIDLSFASHFDLPSVVQDPTSKEGEPGATLAEEMPASDSVRCPAERDTNSGNLGLSRLTQDYLPTDPNTAQKPLSTAQVQTYNTQEDMTLLSPSGHDEPALTVSEHVDNNKSAAVSKGETTENTGGCDPELSGSNKSDTDADQHSTSSENPPDESSASLLQSHHAVPASSQEREETFVFPLEPDVCTSSSIASQSTQPHQSEVDSVDNSIENRSSQDLKEQNAHAVTFTVSSSQQMLASPAYRSASPVSAGETGKNRKPNPVKVENSPPFCHVSSASHTNDSSDIIVISSEEIDTAANTATSDTDNSYSRLTRTEGEGCSNEAQAVAPPTTTFVNSNRGRTTDRRARGRLPNKTPATLRRRSVKLPAGHNSSKSSYKESDSDSSSSCMDFSYFISSQGRAGLLMQKPSTAAEASSTDGDTTKSSGNLQTDNVDILLQQLKDRLGYDFEKEPRRRVTQGCETDAVNMPAASIITSISNMQRTDPEGEAVPENTKTGAQPQAVQQTAASAPLQAASAIQPAVDDLTLVLQPPPGFENSLDETEEPQAGTTSVMNPFSIHSDKSHITSSILLPGTERSRFLSTNSLHPSAESTHLEESRSTCNVRFKLKIKQQSTGAETTSSTFTETGWEQSDCSKKITVAAPSVRPPPPPPPSVPEESAPSSNTAGGSSSSGDAYSSGNGSSSNSGSGTSSEGTCSATASSEDAQPTIIYRRRRKATTSSKSARQSRRVSAYETSAKTRNRRSLSHAPDGAEKDEKEKKRRPKAILQLLSKNLRRCTNRQLNTTANASMMYLPAAGPSSTGGTDAIASAAAALPEEYHLSSAIATNITETAAATATITAPSEIAETGQDCETAVAVRTLTEEDMGKTVRELEDQKLLGCLPRAGTELALLLSTFLEQDKQQAFYKVSKTKKKQLISLATMCYIRAEVRPWGVRLTKS
ncbi:hypothetical protein BaRGS_00003159, partial [Batillaria attramentaria]